MSESSTSDRDIAERIGYEDERRRAYELAAPREVFERGYGHDAGHHLHEDELKRERGDDGAQQHHHEMCEIGCARVEEHHHQYGHHREGGDIDARREGGVHGEREKCEQRREADHEDDRAVVVEISRPEEIHVAVERGQQYHHEQYLSGYRIVVLGYLRACATLVHHLLVCLEYRGYAGGHDVTLVDDALALLHHTYRGEGLLICVGEQVACGHRVDRYVGAQHL